MGPNCFHRKEMNDEIQAFPLVDPDQAKDLRIVSNKSNIDP